MCMRERHTRRLQKLEIRCIDCSDTNGPIVPYDSASAAYSVHSHQLVARLGRHTSTTPLSLPCREASIERIPAATTPPRALSGRSIRAGCAAAPRQDKCTSSRTAQLTPSPAKVRVPRIGAWRSRRPRSPRQRVSHSPLTANRPALVISPGQGYAFRRRSDWASHAASRGIPATPRGSPEESRPPT